MLNILKRWSNAGKDGFNVKGLLFDSKKEYPTTVNFAFPSHKKIAMYVIDAGDRRVEIAGSKAINVELKDPFIMYELLTNVKLKNGDVRYNFAVVHQAHMKWFEQNFNFEIHRR